MGGNASKSPKKDKKKLNRKISLLIKEEGMPRKQAVAVALSLLKRGEL